MSDRRVAITGMGVISPLGNDVQTFWSNIAGGTCGIDFITRFDTSDLKVKVAAEVKGFVASDYMDFTAEQRSDLNTKYALAASLEAVTDSGIEGNIDPERFGVYVGSAIGGMLTLTVEHEKMLTAGPRRVSPLFVPMVIANMPSGAVAMRYNAQGPALPVVTACATSTSAIGEAYRAIKHGYADAILAGGTEAPLLPLAVAGFINAMAISRRNDPKSSCIPFDARRDGFVIAEGAGVLVLEEYEHAVARGAKIYAEIKGYGHTCDAYHATSPQPEGRGCAAAIRAALTEADALAWQDGTLYINAHGTSTVLNDKIETLAIKAALGERAKGVFISSTKSMTGHMMGAVGAIEAIIGVLSLRDGIVPPTIGLEQPDPECDLNYVPGKAIKAPLQTVLSNSMGFGGHNACLVISRGE